MPNKSPTEGMDAAVEAGAHVPSAIVGHSILGETAAREAIDAALPHLRAAWEQETREKLLALDWQEVNAAAEEMCPSREHRPFGCAKCVVQAALNTAFEQEEGK